MPFGDDLLRLFGSLGPVGLLAALFVIFYLDSIVIPLLPEVFAILIFQAGGATLEWGLIVLALAEAGEVLGNTTAYLVVRRVGLPARVRRPQRGLQSRARAGSDPRFHPRLRGDQHCDRLDPEAADGGPRPARRSARRAIIVRGQGTTDEDPNVRVGPRDDLPDERPRPEPAVGEEDADCGVINDAGQPPGADGELEVFADDGPVPATAQDGLLPERAIVDGQPRHPEGRVARGAERPHGSREGVVHPPPGSALAAVEPEARDRLGPRRTETVTDPRDPVRGGDAVRIEERDDRRPRLPDADALPRADSLPGRLRHPRAMRLRDPRGPVATKAVHDDHLVPRTELRDEGIQRRAEVRFLVIRRDHDGQHFRPPSGPLP